jgi:uncharacterized protein YlzI (FlbEa/FlbD family)
MKNNFIKLTKKNGTPVNVNPILIESIEGMENGFTLISMGFGSINVHHVTETIDEINKLIEKSNYFTTYIK